MSATKSFRQSMGQLHTWAGVLMGGLLFVVFWMGSLSVFDREIDRWMMPGTRLSPADMAPPLHLDGAPTQAIQALTAGAAQWFIRLPTERTPAIELRWQNPNTQAQERRFLHPQTGAVLAGTHTLAASGFIFPFHYSLHLKWKDLGKWLVGAAGMTVLVMLVSGVVTHRRLLADFFLFRPRKKIHRSALDLHNLTGVLALPFHFCIALSGVVIFFALYWPSSLEAVYFKPTDKPAFDSARAFAAEGQGQWRRPPAKDAAVLPLASLDAARTQAERHWQAKGHNQADRQVSFIRVFHPGNSASFIELRRSHAGAIGLHLDQLYLDAATHRELSRFEAAPVMAVQRFIAGLHLIQFDHWLLRWLYFLGGLCGCLMIATGFVFWLESRRARHTKHGWIGVRLVETLAVGAMPGVMLATLAFLVANRLLADAPQIAGAARSDLEMGVFFSAWLVALAHAALRAQSAWWEQSAGIACASLLAFGLNGLTTGEHLLGSLANRQWAVAGVDGALLVLAAAAAFAAARARSALSRPPGQSPVGQNPVKPPLAALGSKHIGQVGHG